jgi:hypothetical protein
VPESANLDIAYIYAVDPDTAGLGIESAVSNIRAVDLPAPVAPTSATAPEGR